MNFYEKAAFRGRRGFVYLRYVSIIFFFLSQFATYFLVANALTHAADALNALQALDVVGIIESLASFKLAGNFGTFIAILRELGCLVIPLYFIATVSLVLTQNKADIYKTLWRTALIAIFMCIAEYFVYSVMVGFVIVLVDQLFQNVVSTYPDIMGVLNDIIYALNEGGVTLPVNDIEQAVAMAESFATNQLSLLLLRNMPSFNIFLDQVLCLLMCIFLRTKPDWANTRAKTLLFRSLGIIPVAYIAAAFTLNGLAQSSIIKPSLLIMSLFPAKRLPHFLFVICILACNRMYPVKDLSAKQGMRYAYIPPKSKYSATPLVFETPEKAKSRALHAAIFLSVCLAVLSLADFGLSFLPYAAKWGLGKSYFAVFCIPFLFFYDDRKPTLKRDYTIYSVVYFIVLVYIVFIYLFY